MSKVSTEFRVETTGTDGENYVEYFPNIEMAGVWFGYVIALDNNTSVILCKGDKILAKTTSQYDPLA